MTVQMDLSNRCNLRCRTCHFSNDEIFNGPAHHVSIERIQRLSAELFPVTRRLLLSCATEPLVSPILSEVLRMARTAGVPRIEFVSNGVLLLGKHLRAILETQVNLIQISVDGATAETFESIRSGASYRKVLGNLLLLQRLKNKLGVRNPEIQLNFVLMRENQHELEAFIEMCALVGASADVRHLLTTPFTERSGLGQSSLRFDRATANIYLDRARDLAQRLGVRLWSFPQSFALDEEETRRHRQLHQERTCGRGLLHDFLALQHEMQSAALPELDNLVIQQPRRIVPCDELQAYFEFRAGNGGDKGCAVDQVRKGASRCPLPYDFAFIDYAGTVKPCPYWSDQLPLGSVERSSFGEVWNGEGFDALRASHISGKLHATCNACPVISRGSVNSEESFVVKLPSQKKVA